MTNQTQIDFWESRMKLTIVNRKKLLEDFNETNGTTFVHSRYTGCKISGMDCVFSHCNGVGFKRVCFEWNSDDGIFTRRGVFDGLKKHLSVNR